MFDLDRRERVNYQKLIGGLRIQFWHDKLGQPDTARGLPYEIRAYLSLAIRLMLVIVYYVPSARRVPILGVLTCGVLFG